MVRKILVFGISMVLICFTLVGCKVNYELSGLGGFEGLDPEIELQIIKTYFGEDYKGQESIDKKIISDYLGTYGDCVAIIIDSGRNRVTVLSVELVDEIYFIYPYSFSIYIWKENKFYSLTELHEQGFLTRNDLEEIYVKNEDFYQRFYDQWDERIKEFHDKHVRKEYE